MIHVFYKNRNTIGQFMVALMFLGTFGFLFTYDGFVAESTATSCCGGGEVVVSSFTVDSSGDYGSDIPMDVELTGGCHGGTDNGPNPSSESSGSSCNCLTGGLSGSYTCSSNVCSSENACGQNTVSSCNTDEGGVCEDKISGDDCGCNAVCKLDGNHSTTCDAKGCQGP